MLSSARTYVDGINKKSAAKLWESAQQQIVSAFFSAGSAVVSGAQGFIKQSQPAKDQPVNKLNLEKIKFDTNNAEQRKYINACINRFSEHLNRLVMPDQIYSLAMFVNVACLLTDYSHPLICVVPAAIETYVLLQCLDRPKKVKQVQEDLVELRHIYQWMIRNQSIKITQDKMVLAVFNAIAPFEKLNHLCPWKLFETKMEDISYEFARGLAEWHGIPLEMTYPDAENRCKEIAIQTDAVESATVAWPLFFQHATTRKAIPLVYHYEDKASAINQR